MTDLIGDLLNRADGSLEQLKLHYGPLIRYVINPILHDARDREEVFSDILIRVWDRVDQYDPNSGSWTNWLSTIARNAAIDRLRCNPPPPAELTETIPAPRSDPDYVSYTVAEIQDGWSIDAWINYTHQTPWPQYPVITAKQKEQTMGVSDTHTFKTIQDALQFFPGEDTK